MNLNVEISVPSPEYPLVFGDGSENFPADRLYRIHDIIVDGHYCGSRWEEITTLDSRDEKLTTTKEVN